MNTAFLLLQRIVALLLSVVFDLTICCTGLCGSSLACFTPHSIVVCAKLLSARLRLRSAESGTSCSARNAAQLRSRKSSSLSWTNTVTVCRASSQLILTRWRAGSVMELPVALVLAKDHIDAKPVPLLQTAVLQYKTGDCFARIQPRYLTPASGRRCSASG